MWESMRIGKVVENKGEYTGNGKKKNQARPCSIIIGM